MNTESLRLLDDAVLVRLEAAPDKIGRIFVPDTAQRNEIDMYTGTVLKTGPGRKSVKTGRVTPIDVSPGDKVLLYFTAVKCAECVYREDGFDHYIISEKLIQMAWTN